MPPPPLLGYNNNVRHRGRIFHIQTEDSGVGHARIMTHLFADGGRIVKSTRTDYSEHLGRADLVETVRNLMKEQHKAMFIALRGGEFDALLGFEDDAPPASIGAAEVARDSTPSPVSKPAKKRSSSAPGADRASSPSPARARNPESGVRKTAEESRSYAAPRPATIFAEAPVRDSLFGETVMEKSLDETILSYLSEDAEAADGSR